MIAGNTKNGGSYVNKVLVRLFFIPAIFFMFLTPLWAEQESPPANVVVSKITSGTIAPEEEFIGTVYYPEVSDVSAEVSGTVKSIRFEEGDRAKKGQVLVKLDSDLLEKTFQAKKALYEQTLSDLQLAQKDLDRTVTLYRKRIVSEQNYDNQKFLVRGLEKKAASLQADVERLHIELEKTIIGAPFDGVIIKKHVARGEWMSPGKSVATVARNDAVDIIVEVPERIIQYLIPGMDITVMAGGSEHAGTLIAIIPKGDVSTRTFPVKIRINHIDTLLEGMEARVKLPGGEKITTLLVPRDAVINMFGRDVIAVVIDSKAKIVPTRVIGYTKTHAGINSQNISEGMPVVVKGNERLRDDQPVNILKELD